MKKFQFGLQRLLEIRQKREDEQRIRLAKASAAYQMEVNAKNRILDNIGDYRKKLSKTEKLNLGQLQEFDYFVTKGSEGIKEIEKEMEKKRVLMQKELDIYVEKKKERRTVEILREKALTKHQEETLREEQAILDEIGIRIYEKNKAESKKSENTE